MMRLRSMATSVMLVGVLGSAGVPSTAHARTPCGDLASRPWCDGSLSPDRRAGLLLSALRQDEKLDLMSGDDPLGALLATEDESRHVGTLRGVPRLGVPTLHFADGPAGVRQGRGTALAAPLSLAASFDPAAAQRAGALVGDEARLKGNHLLHGPAVDVLRNGRWGRSFESYGEDPYLAAGLGSRWVRGLQGQGVMANVKHFPVYNQETNRFFMENLVSPRVEREIYLPPFEAAVRDGGAATVMCAYNHTNGEPSCSSQAAIERTLRGDWGFRGFVVADYVMANRDAVASVTHGVDLDMPVGLAYAAPILRGLLATGKITQSAIDGHVRNLLRTLFAFGVFDRAPYPNDGSRIDYAGHARQAGALSAAGITLLKNTGILPLRATAPSTSTNSGAVVGAGAGTGTHAGADAAGIGASPGGGTEVRKIAIIGWPADTYHAGGGSAEVRPRSLITPRQGITARAGAGVRVTYTDGRDARAAAAAAKAADAALVFAADSRGESSDVSCLSLRCSNSATPVRDPDALIEKVAAANPETVVVLETGGPVLTPWADRVKGIVETWYPGQHGGTALAAVLFGDADPGGRLPVTFPVAETDAPTAGDPDRFPGTGGLRAHYSEGVFTGYRHYDQERIKPRFPFGHGLSYTTFDLREPTVRSDRAGTATVEITVVNTGRRTGTAVPQLYLGLPAPNAGTPQPRSQLKGFRKVVLAPGQSRRVRFALGPRELSYWDQLTRSWRIAPGCYRAVVGFSSRHTAAEGAFPQAGGTC